MSHPQKNYFEPKNKQKYSGQYPIVSRRSWEWDFMMYCDNHPDVLEWASEPRDFGSGRGGIPYMDPLTQKQTIYIPDFLVTFLDKSGARHTKLFEIKPKSQTMAEHAGNKADALVRMRNQAKWAAAAAWCMRRGIDFIVMTEGELFGGARALPGAYIRPLIKAQPKKAVVKKPKTVAQKRQLTALANLRKIKKRVAVVKKARAAKARKR